MAINIAINIPGIFMLLIRDVWFQRSETWMSIFFIGTSVIKSYVEIWRFYFSLFFPILKIPFVDVSKIYNMYSLNVIQFTVYGLKSLHDVLAGF